MQISKAKKIVIKLGSSTIVDSRGKFKKKWLLSLIQDIKKLRKNNQEVVIVSSGSIALGQSYLKIKNKKVKIEMSQAVASVGQIHLINEFQRLFEKNKIKIGQILITPDDTEQRRRALNARRTFENLFELKAIPVVNENDTTATSEIKYGDNDRLAARVAQIIGADLLIILSDVDGLYKKISNEEIFSLVNKTINTYGSGGMLTKLEAAKICMNAGCNMLIANGKIFKPIQNIISKKLYTWFKPKISNLDARKKWIISSLSSSAKIYVDRGASKALKSGKSLLPAGIIRLEGNFKKGDNIVIVDENNTDIARALSSFTSEEINKIKGLQSSQIENILGYASKSEIIHRDDIVII
jgi:glutamate 5-kinase